ncbi:hypothetical protein JT305_24260 [Salmonella enterica subsp. enterica serovar Senftenberg]|nr:hypothetical protein [Salmonella enterica subsp. enterica serovar Senftenberg]
MVFVELARFISLARGTRVSRKRLNCVRRFISLARGTQDGSTVKGYRTGLSAGAGNTRAGLIEAPDVFYLAGAGNTDRDRDRAGRSAVYLAGAGNTIP